MFATYIHKKNSHTPVLSCVKNCMVIIYTCIFILNAIQINKGKYLKFIDDL